MPFKYEARHRPKLSYAAQDNENIGGRYIIDSTPLDLNLVSRLKIRPDERALAWFVREPFPSVSTGTSMRSGKLSGRALQITSHMNDGGVVFADGIEQDFLTFDWGKTLSVRQSQTPLNFVI